MNLLFLSSKQERERAKDRVFVQKIIFCCVSICKTFGSQKNKVVATVPPSPTIITTTTKTNIKYQRHTNSQMDICTIRETAVCHTQFILLLDGCGSRANVYLIASKWRECVCRTELWKDDLQSMNGEKYFGLHTLYTHFYFDSDVFQSIQQLQPNRNDDVVHIFHSLWFFSCITHFKSFGWIIFIRRTTTTTYAL